MISDERIPASISRNLQKAAFTASKPEIRSRLHQSWRVLTLNVAKAHTDAASSPYGKRLVYGGYTISMASAQIVRALPNLVTLLAWRSCDHTEPVFEGDVLRTEFTIDAKHTLASGGGLVDLHAVVHAARGDQAPALGADASVLDWRVIGLMA